MTPAVACAIAAGALAWSVAGLRASARLPHPAGPTWSPPSLGWLEARFSGTVVSAAVAFPAAVVAGPAVGLAVAVLAVALTTELRDGLHARRRAGAATAWRVALGAVAVALSAGLTLPDALARGSHAAGVRTPDGPVAGLGAAASAARLGGDIVGALEDRCPTGTGARLVACLRVAVGTGVAPAILAVRLGEAVAADEQAVRAATVALASARATTRVLAVLPLAGVGLAAAFGASAVAYLLGNPTGHACLLAAAVLEATGLRWSAHLVPRDAA